MKIEKHWYRYQPKKKIGRALVFTSGGKIDTANRHL